MVAGPIENSNLSPLIKRAVAGSADAQFELGQIYQLGKDVAVNYQTAKQYYQAAAKQNHVNAQIELGLMYYLNQLGSNQLDAAYYWFHKAADNDNAAAQWLIGVMYFNGQSVEQDNVKSYVWLSLASEKGHPRAQLNKSQLYGALTKPQLLAAEQLINQFKRQHGYPIQPTTTKTKPNLEQSKIEKPSVATSKQNSKNNYRVQIGAFNEKQLAETELKRLRKKAPTLLDSSRVTIVASHDADAVIYRLHLLGYANRNEAVEQCMQLKTSKISCFVTKSH